MESFELSTLAALTLGGAVLFLPAFAFARRGRKGKGASGTSRGEAARLEAIEAMQAEISTRLDALSAAQNDPEDRLKGMAGQILTLIRDKNATFETAMAGLEQLRTRLRAVEEIGDLAETRELLKSLDTRMARLKSDQAKGIALLEARLSAVEAPGVNPFSEISAQLTKLYEQKDSGISDLLDRFSPLETRLSELEGRQIDRDMLARFETQLREMRDLQGETRADLAALSGETRSLNDLGKRMAAMEDAMASFDPKGRAGELANRIDRLKTALITRETALKKDIAELTKAHDATRASLGSLRAETGSVREISSRMEKLHTQRDAFAESLTSRLGKIEERLAASGETPFVEISKQLTELYAQKDALVETVFARLAPLEDKLDALEARDPKALLDRFAERMASLQERVTSLETPGEAPFAEISEQLTRLYAQKDATVETVFARLAPLEEKLDALEARDPQARFDQLTERLSGVKEAGIKAETALKDRIAALEARDDPSQIFERIAALKDRMDLLETAESGPFAELSERLTRLYEQKDTTLATVLARLAPLEEKLDALEARDPQALLDRFAERLEGLKARVDVLETPGENPFAEISEQLTRLYAQKDSTVETVFARLAPLEEKLDALEARDPQALLDRFAERLEGLKARVDVLETPGENPFAEISEQLTRLYAQKDSTVETVFARLGPLEARLAELARDIVPRAQLDSLVGQVDGLRASQSASETKAISRFADLAARLEALDWAQDETAARIEAITRVADALGDGDLAELRARITELGARDAVETQMLIDRLQPLETRLETLEARPFDPEAEAARAEAQAVAAQMIAARAAAEHTELFANRLALLEASLPRISAAQSVLMKTLKLKEPTEPGTTSDKARTDKPATKGDAGSEDIWDLPQLVSLHRK